MLTKKMQADKALVKFIGLEEVYRRMFVGQDIYDWHNGRAKVLDVDLIRETKEEGRYDLRWRFTLDFAEFDLRKTVDISIDSVVSLLPPKQDVQP